MRVISKIDFSDWVYVKKKDKKIRVCADFSTGLNNCLKDHTYPLPSPEDIFSKLNGGKVSSKIDMSEAYLQVTINEESSKLLAISIHKGLFKLNRLPFGLKVTPSLFQQVIDTMLAGLEFTLVYIDDILLRSENNEQHRKHLKAVFQKVDECGFKLGSEKCKFFMKRIKYLEQIIEENGRRPDPERPEAIKNMPSPNNVINLQVFFRLGQLL